MQLVKFKTYATPLDGELEFASLKSSGLNPVFSNYARGTDDALMLPTQGGVTILLPADELEKALEYFDQLEVKSKNAFEPLKRKRRPLAGPILLISLFLTWWIIGGLKFAVILIVVFGAIPTLASLHAKKLTRNR